jgi:hypothetical protein
VDGVASKHANAAHSCPAKPLSPETRLADARFPLEAKRLWPLGNALEELVEHGQFALPRDDAFE